MSDSTGPHGRGGWLFVAFLGWVAMIGVSALVIHTIVNDPQLSRLLTQHQRGAAAGLQQALMFAIALQFLVGLTAVFSCISYVARTRPLQAVAILHYVLVAALGIGVVQSGFVVAGASTPGPAWVIAGVHVAWALGWILYFLRSRRVRNTFGARPGLGRIPLDANGVPRP
jgi:hypothetical protein